MCVSLLFYTYFRFLESVLHYVVVIRSRAFFVTENCSFFVKRVLYGSLGFSIGFTNPWIHFAQNAMTVWGKDAKTEMISLVTVLSAVLTVPALWVGGRARSYRARGRHQVFWGAARCQLSFNFHQSISVHIFLHLRHKIKLLLVLMAFADVVWKGVSGEITKFEREYVVLMIVILLTVSIPIVNNPVGIYLTPK